MHVEAVPIQFGEELAHQVVERSIPMKQCLATMVYEVFRLDPVPGFRLAEPQFRPQPIQVAPPIVCQVAESLRERREEPGLPIIFGEAVADRRKC